MKVKLSELPDNHLFVHGVYIWNKKTMGDDIGGIRAMSKSKETFWRNIPSDTLVYPMVNAVESEVRNGTNP